MDKLRALRYFIKLADTLSFSETASFFRVPSSSVSRRIRDLEEQLGIELFHRTTRSVRLTDLGQLYFNDVNPAIQGIQLADDLVSEQSKRPSGLIRITAMPGYGELLVLPALEELQRLYPEIVLDVDFTDQVIDLASNAMDIAIRASSALPDYVVARRLTDHQFVLVASSAYLAENGVPRSVSDLEMHKGLMYRGPSGVLQWRAQQDGLWKEVKIRPTYISNHGPSLVNSARDGRGLAFLPRWGLVEYLESGELVEITIEGEHLTINGVDNSAVYLLYHPPKFKIKKIRVVVDHLVKALSRRY